MVAEVDPLEASEKRKSNANNQESDLPPLNSRISDTATTKSHESTMVKQSDCKNHDPSPISKEFQPIIPSTVKSPTLLTVTATKVANVSAHVGTRDALNVVDPTITNNTLAAVSINPVCTTLQAHENSTCVSNGGDQDTVDKPNGPLVSNVSMVSSKSAIVNSSQALSAATGQAESLASTNGEVSPTKVMSVSKKVSFTGAQMTNNDHSKHQTTTVSFNLSKASTGIQKPEINPLASSAIPSENSASSTTASRSESATSTIPFESPAPTDEVQRARMPLVDHYGSFIHPTDTSLADARNRLKKALDQTRILRAAFTDRVYEKYKVILRPVPDHVDLIVEKITADPISRKAELVEEIRIVKEEKEVEKREAQKLAGAGVFSSTSSSDPKHPVASLVSSAETAEQLAYVGAGLNLVILPEEDMQDSGIDLGKYQHRGPTNPETGQRVGGISAAAATAAEAILDRVRRASFLRTERQRRQPNPEGSTEEPNKNSILSRYQLLSSTTSAAVSNTSSQASLHVAPKQTKKAVQSKGTPHSNASTKPGRVRNQPIVSVGSILTLNPLVEDLDPDRKPSAATSALLARGVGRKHLQQQWRHPFPDSLGGRKPALPYSSSRTSDILSYGVGLDSFSGNTPGLDLPLFPMLTGRNEKRVLTFHDRKKTTTDRAKKALESILSQFVSASEFTTSRKDERHDRNEQEKTDTYTHLAGSKRNRRATEIGLLHGMQHVAEAEGRIGSSTAPRMFDGPAVPSTIQGPLMGVTEHTDSDPIEPIVAFSVLQSLGLIHDTPLSHRDQSQPIGQRLKQIHPIVDRTLEKSRACASSKFLAVYQKVISRKRSFTEAFASEISSSERHRSIETPAASSDTIVPKAIVEAKQVPKNDSHKSSSGPTTEDAGGEPREKEWPVVSIRGGGKGEEESSKPTGARDSSTHKSNTSDGSIETLKRPKSAPSTPSLGKTSSSRPSSSSLTPCSFATNMRASSSDGLFSAPLQNRGDGQGSAGGSFAAQQNAGFGLAAATVAHQGVVNRMHAQAQAHQLHLQAAAMNRLSSAGELSNFFGTGIHQRQGFGGHADWAALGNASQSTVGLLPSQTSLTALGINPHQAAMLELSARDRAARVMLAREQQASVVHAAAVRQASVMRTGAVVSGLSSQQAAALMNAQVNQAGAGLYSTSTASRFGQLGGHSAATAAAILSSPAATAALMGQSQLPVGAMSGHLVLSQHPGGQHTESRPSSQHSVSSTKSTKGKRPSSSKGRKELKDEPVQTGTNVSSKPKPPTDEINESHSNTKRKASDLTSALNTEIETLSMHTEKKIARDSMLDKEGDRTYSPISNGSPPRKKAAVVASKVEQQDDSSFRKSQPDSLTEIMRQPIGFDEDSSADVRSDVPSPAQPPATAGMQFFVPPIPPSLDPHMASCALDGRIHVAISKLFLPSGQLCSVHTTTVLLDYVQAVGSAVPIPKALVSNPLKERLNFQSLKTSSNGGHTPTIPRDLVVAIVLVWLWVQHKDSFQRAFAKSGRIDVDPECKWLIQAAVDAASRALMLELTEAIQHGGPLASALSSARNKGGSSSAKPSGSELEKQATASITVDARVALIVSEALMTELCIDEEIDAVLPMYEDLVQLLDETRMNALKAKCRERVLLAAVVAQRATMSETFAHAYVSSMVRAGEALDHGELFELVQDEETSTSTMIPYDIFSDETRAWEDPCRPVSGFHPNLTGEDLVRRAHARGMIIKSLKKMQDRNNIKGGTPDSGPYAERIQSQGQSLNEAKALQRTSSGNSKRRTSFSLVEKSVQAGTGSSKAMSLSQYNPHHVSTPLFWDTTSIENMPYGQHSKVSKTRSSSISVTKDDGKESLIRGQSGVSNTATPIQSVGSIGEDHGDEIFRRSSEEVDWAEVAKGFLTVDLGGGPIPSRRRSSKVNSPTQNYPRNHGNKTIFAPFCNRIDDANIVGEESGSEEEDLSDETIQMRHKVVLDNMKARLDKFMEGRTTAGQRARQRAQARAAEKASVD